MGTCSTVVACVCRTSEKYTPRVVEWMARQVKANIRTPHLFQCLTNEPDKMPGGVALEHDWPRWWPKLELFRPGRWPDGITVLYLDMDAVLLGPLQVPAPPPAGGLGMLKFGTNWYAPMGSGVMLWRTPLTIPYEWFLPVADETMKCLPGDQEAIISAMLSNGRHIHAIPGVSAQEGHGERYVPTRKPRGCIWCTAGNGPRSFEVTRSWIPPL